MKTATINLPDAYIDCIAVLVDMGYYPSRSEAIRVALREFLPNETELLSELDAEKFYRLKIQESLS
jgi:Arc/MetJ-type ribon-helix-helix transcriptional regulator